MTLGHPVFDGDFERITTQAAFEDPKQDLGMGENKALLCSSFWICFEKLAQTCTSLTAGVVHSLPSHVCSVIKVKPCLDVRR